MTNLVELLRKQVDEKKYLDIGPNSASAIGVGRTKLRNAVDKLCVEGYRVYYIKLSMPEPHSNLHTSIKVLTKPEVTFQDVYQNRDKIAKLEGEM